MASRSKEFRIDVTTRLARPRPQITVRTVLELLSATNSLCVCIYVCMCMHACVRLWLSLLGSDSSAQALYRVNSSRFARRCSKLALENVQWPANSQFFPLAVCVCVSHASCVARASLSLAQNECQLFVAKICAQQFINK